MIKTETEMGLASTFILNADILVKNSDTGFALHFLTITGNNDLGVSGSITGFSISGRNGAIWDDSGNVIAGFKQGIPFNIELHHDTGAKSLFKDGIIMKSFNSNSERLTTLQFEKSPDSSLSATLFNDESFCVLGDDSGISAFYYDNELFTCL